jgi:predicted dehydrogenase
MKVKRENTVRYAVAGLGYISQSAVLPAFEHVQNSQLVALFSGDPKKREELGKKYDVPSYGYEELERAMIEEQIDALYIATPNTLHREFVERASRAHVHSLCEKPMATTEIDCQAMIDAARENGVKLMVAYRLHFTDSNMEAVELANSGHLGELRLFHSLFTMQVSRGNIRTHRRFGGGTLFDIGIYCVNAARYMFQNEPVEVTAVSGTGLDERFREVEESVSAVLRFPGDQLAAFTCSFGTASNSEYAIVGTKGTLKVENAFEYTGEIKWTITTSDRTHRRTFPAGDQFAAEIDYFSQCILSNREPEPSGVEGLADVRIINALYQSAREGRPVPVERVFKYRKPNVSQEMKRAPLAGKPELINVQFPHT